MTKSKGAIYIKGKVDNIRRFELSCKTKVVVVVDSQMNKQFDLIRRRTFI